MVNVHKDPRKGSEGTTDKKPQLALSHSVEGHLKGGHQWGPSDAHFPSGCDLQLSSLEGNLRVSSFISVAVQLRPG